MKLKDLKKFIPINPDDVEVAPENLVEDHFSKQHAPVGKDYRDLSIDYMVKNRISFASTFNSLHNVVERFVKVKCPACHCFMKINGGGGGAHVYSVHFECPHCHTKTYISLSHEAISFDFEDNKTK